MRSRFLYARLAAQSLRLNARSYLPYLLSCMVTVALHYDIQFLNMNHGMEQLPGSSSVHGLLSVVVLAVDLFSVFLFFYTNSFLMKRRHHELGLYRILGMERRHLRKLLRREATFVGVVAIGGGLVLGIGLSQLFIVLFRAVMQVDVPLAFEVPRIAVLYTVFVYGFILLLTLLSNLGRVSFVRPIELLHGTDAGDREPRTRWLVVALGVAFLAAGYFISIFTNPLQSLGSFLTAVLLVIVATYCLFSSGSIAVLKRLRADKEYYYQPRHFFAVASMLHRMRRNAAGLATICVLSTMVLVTASTTLCMYVGAVSGAVQEGTSEVRSLLGAYFFVGLFLSILFLMVVTLIIYYKQVSEGYEDARSFAIMRQVGMSEDEVSMAVRGQISLVFLPPLALAACHLLAALPMTSKILMVFGITDAGFVVTCAALTLLAYGMLYLLVYLLTSRIYHRIVASADNGDLASRRQW
ncbi:MAG: FtsX-like permease family protein [Atopobiaceae bacterium]|nr:FtsX-like permease family protein [Atopobiaceae bacterium]